VRLVQPYVAGLYRKDASQLYVSRGTGFWGPPLRLGAPAEITRLVQNPG
ncbi:MAG: metallophosphoesterase, partial [Deltaproteobacteria bacterium]